MNSAWRKQGYAQTNYLAGGGNDIVGLCIWVAPRGAVTAGSWWHGGAGDWNSMTKKKWAFGLLVVSLAGGLLWWNAARIAKPGASADAKIVAVDRGQVRQVVMASGRISANDEVDIKCKASGEVITLPFDVADKVEKGALVMELDTKDEDRHVEQTDAAYEAAEARVERANQTLTLDQQKLETDRQAAITALHSADVNAKDLRSKANRDKQLLQEKQESPEQAESAETAAMRAELAVDDAQNSIDALKSRATAIEMDRNDVKVAELEAKQAKADLDDAKQQLEYTKVYAPISGVVTTRPAEIGTIVSSGITNVGGGTSVMTLCDLSRLFVLAPVDEADIGKVTREQKVSLSCDAFPDRKFEGKIIRIAAKGLNQMNVVTFEVKIEVVGEGKELLKPEMTTDVEIIVAQRDNVLRVPSEAVKTREKDKKKYVLVPADANATMPAAASAPATGPAATQPAEATKIATVERNVETGVDDGAFCEIISGLKEGDKVVIDTGGPGTWAKNRSDDDY